MSGSGDSFRWITARNYDLLWYIGASLTGYFLIYLNLGLGMPAILLFWLWILLLDGPHVFGTISRTYFDKEEWRNRKSLLLGSLLWLVPGPLVLLFTNAIRSNIPLLVFLTLAQIWAYWHVVRQHYGFLTLYQKKNGERSGKDNPVDYWCFYTLMLAPFVSFLMRHPDARAQVGLPIQPAPAEQIFLWVLNAAVLAALIVYGWKEIRIAKSGSWNLPKNLFLSACVPLHLFIFMHPYISTRVDIRLFAVFITVYHNIQYQGIVWFHNRNRYGSDPGGARFGLASFFSRNFFVYYVAALLYTVLYRYPNWALTAIPFSPRSADFGLHLSDLAIVFWWGFAFHHYYLDQKIWRPSKDRQLAQDLGVNDRNPEVMWSKPVEISA